MRLQLTGAVLVIATLLAAELAALALSASPGSALLWRLNLEMFRAVNATYVMADAFIPLDYSLTISALLTLLAAAVAAYWWRIRLALAVLSNVTFIFCGALAFAAFAPYGGAPVDTASLAPVAVSFDSSGALVLYLLLASLSGAVASHIGYLRRIARRLGNCGAGARTAEGG